MNKKVILSSGLLLWFAYIGNAQKTKTFTEVFLVGDQTVLNINTSKVDFEFETWENDRVEIITQLTLEDSGDKDWEKYLENNPVEISGNSREISISSTSDSRLSYFKGLAVKSSDSIYPFIMEHLLDNVEILDLPELAVIPDFPIMPPMPLIEFGPFDYEAYKKGGDKYMEKWSKNFSKNFDKQYEENMKEWASKVEANAKEWEERNKEKLEEREQRMLERVEEMEARAEERNQRMAAYHKQKSEQLKAKGLRLESKGDHSSKEYLHKKFNYNTPKVEKVIKIKLPKGLKVIMNVKHGEVKMASSMNNVKASLRYASLLASSIEGEDTQITASYSPMVINTWDKGGLEASFCNKIQLDEVRNLRLIAKSSNIVIKNVLEDLHVINDFGQTDIQKISAQSGNTFVQLKNGSLTGQLPKGDYEVFVYENLSSVILPDAISIKKMSKPIDENHRLIKNRIQKNPTLIINSEYSDVVLKN